MHFAIFKVFSTNVPQSHPSKKTRQVRGQERINLRKKLALEKFPEQVYEDMVMAEDGDFVKKTNISSVKSLNVLRKMRSEGLKEEDNSANDLLDIVEEINKNPDLIQKYSIKPFCLITYGKTQMEMLKLLKETNNNIVAYLDATGGLVRNPFTKRHAFYITL